MVYYFTIADVQYTIRTNHLLLPTDMRHNVYRQFLSESRQSHLANELEVDVTDAPAPDLKYSTKIFDTNSSFVIYLHTNDHYVVHAFPMFTSPVWVARIDSEENRITIFCNPEIIEKTENRLIYNPVSYPLDQVLLMNFLASHQGTIIHSAGWCLEEEGYIFAGISGAGKSTISNLIVKETGATFLSDDRIVVRRIGDDFLMYGTPWPGDAGYALNESVPLKGIFFLSKGAENNIRKLNPSDSIARLMPVVSIPWYDREKVELMIDFCDIIMDGIPMYELTFVPGKAAVDMLVKFVGG